MLERVEMDEYQIKKILEENPDISVDTERKSHVEKILKENSEPVAYTERNRHEKVEKKEHVTSEWKRDILLGLLAGLLWVIAIGGLAGGFTLTIVGAVRENMGQLIIGLIVLAVGVIFTVCAKIFHEKLRYGEV